MFDILFISGYIQYMSEHMSSDTQQYKIYSVKNRCNKHSDTMHYEAGAYFAIDKHWPHGQGMYQEIRINLIQYAVLYNQ